MDIGNFVQNIKFYCDRKSVKPTVACREAGVGGSFINNMEARGSVPSVEKVQMLAHYLGVTVSELLGEAQSVVSNPQTFADLTSNAQAPVSELERLNALLNAEGQAKLLDIADDMVSSGKYRNKNAASVG